MKLVAFFPPWADLTSQQGREFLVMHCKRDRELWPSCKILSRKRFKRINKKKVTVEKSSAIEIFRFVFNNNGRKLSNARKCEENGNKAQLRHKNERWINKTGTKKVSGTVNLLLFLISHFRAVLRFELKVFTQTTPTLVEHGFAYVVFSNGISEIKNPLKFRAGFKWRQHFSSSLLFRCVGETQSETQWIFKLHVLSYDP